MIYFLLRTVPFSFIFPIVIIILYLFPRPRDQPCWTFLVTCLFHRQPVFPQFFFFPYTIKHTQYEYFPPGQPGIISRRHYSVFFFFSFCFKPCSLTRRREYFNRIFRDYYFYLGKRQIYLEIGCCSFHTPRSVELNPF